jgi:hypothetical protein
MLDLMTPSRASPLPQGSVFAAEKKGPHPAKETAPETLNLWRNDWPSRLSDKGIFNYFIRPK